MLTQKILAGIVVSVLFYASIAGGTTYYVDPNGSDSNDGLSWATAFKTIQHGIDVAKDYNIVEVNEGTYPEAVDFNGTACTVRSNDPNDWDVVAATVIDFGASRNEPNCVLFVNGEGSNSIFTGITVTGGYGHYSGHYAGGAIYCEGSNPTIRRCVLKNNMNDIDVDTFGGAIACYDGAEPLIENCMISDNGAGYGGGISIWSGSSPEIRNCMIWGNNAFSGGGIYLYGGSNVKIGNCTIVDNDGGICSDNSTEAITNCIIWDNGDDLHDCAATYSCVEDGDSGTGNISSYPYFADYGANDFHLTWNSPCINKGDPCGSYSGETDIDFEERIMDGRIDMGADELNTIFDNLVKNPGFEITDVNNDPCYWSFSPDGSGGDANINDNDSNSGNNSWQFTQSTSYGKCRGIQEYINVEPSKYYKLSGCVKCISDPINLEVAWCERDANNNVLPENTYYAIQDSKPTEWEQYSGCWLIKNELTKFLTVKLMGPFYTEAAILWDDISLTEVGTLYLHPYGCVNEPNIAETVNFGTSGLNEDWVVEINDTNVISAPSTDPCDENITYRELKAGKTITIEFPGFNVDSEDYNCPNSPMLLEIMFKDTVGDTSTVSVYSKIDYVDLDPNYKQSSSDRDYYLTYLGGLEDGDWKYMQYGFQKSHYQLLRAIDGKYTIKIENDNDNSDNLPIDYISLRAVTTSEYEALADKQRSLIGYYEADLPADAPSPPPDYNELTVFVRDIMRPVYRHTKPDLNEPNYITGFSCWGEVEPLSFSIYSEEGINDINITVSSLTHSEDSNFTISGGNISIYQVVYDETRLNYFDPKSYALLPDRLEEFTKLSIEPNTSESVWLKVQVPDACAGKPTGLYEGTVTIERTGEQDINVPIDFTIYDINLDRPESINPIWTGPYSRIVSSDMNVVFEALSETGLDPFECPKKYYISANCCDGCDCNEPSNWDFNSNNFKEAVQRMVDEGYAKDTIQIWILSGYIYKDTWEDYNYPDKTSTGVDPNMYYILDENDFKTGFGLYVEEYVNAVHEVNSNLEVVFFAVDEPDLKSKQRIYADRLFSIIKDPCYVDPNYGAKTTSTYYTTCDEPCPNDNGPTLPEEGYYNVPGDGNIPPLTDLVDYKLWRMADAGEGYRRHNDPCDSDYYGEGEGGYYGYYTTGHSHYRNPVYNRFLHGLFAFRTSSKSVTPYSIGSYPNYFSDPYNDFDVKKGIHCIHPYPSPDYLFAYPTWSSKLLHTIGGLEGIREGIKDNKYTTTLTNLIATAEDPNNPTVAEAQGYLDGIKSKINPNYYTAYYYQYTDLGYYGAILEDINDANDFEAFTRIRKDVAEYIVLLSSLATEPNPADEANNVGIDTSLRWKTGKCALSYGVYLGIDYNDVNDANTSSPEYLGSTDSNNFDPNGLQYYTTTYYWRIDSNSVAGTAKGSVWSFTTQFDPNFVGWWKFDEDEGATAYDSAGDNDGTVVGATWTTGQIDGGLSFDGFEDFVIVGDESELEQQKFTLSFWAQLDNPSGNYEGGIAKGYIFGSTTEYSYTLDFHNGNARASITNTSNTGFDISGSIGDSGWHMWSMTAGGGTLTLYKDGDYVDSTAYTGTIDYTKTFNVFVIGAKGYGEDYYFDGVIDDVRFYDEALSAGEIEQLYEDGS